MPSQTNIYRREAVEAMQSSEVGGKPLQLIPGWVTCAYWFVLAIVVAGMAFICLAWVGDYAEGHAVVRMDGRLELTSPSGGIVSNVDVAAGEKVHAGQVLVRFYDGQERQELDRATREFEMRLVRVLLNPADEPTRQTLSSLRAQREAAEAKWRERALIAPAPGVIAGVRTRPGQQLNPGDVALTLTEPKNGGFSIVALVPGQFRPLLKSGMPMRLELVGFPQVYQTLEIESVGADVVGPTEVRRYLGADLADTVPLRGSLVVVRGRLNQSSFTFDGKNYPFYDGIPAKVEVKIRTLRLLVMLFPAARGLFANGV